MIKVSHIPRYLALAVLLHLLLALAPAMAQNVAYQGETTTLAVEQMSGDTYSWELYDDGTVDFAITPGMTTSASYATFVGGNVGASVQVQWLKPGLYFFKVTAFNITGCTMNIKIGIIKVEPSIPTATLKLTPTEICDDGVSVAQLEIAFTGPGPWNMILQAKDKVTGSVTTETYTNIPETGNPMTITVNPKATTEYTVIEVSNKYATNTNPSDSVTLTVHPLPEKTPIYLKKP
jgi:hypothetical protein